MPMYEYRCRDCQSTFELRRPSVEADAPAPCPSGHTNAARLLSVFAAPGRSSYSSMEPSSMGPVAGGSCGSGCMCHGG